jgi:hypothetical protein
MALTKVTYSMIEGAAFNVLDFGADPTGVASSVSAFNAAVANGGTVYVPSGTYKLDGKVTLTVDDTTLYLAANVTLNVSGVIPSNTLSEFGAQILVYANNCAIIGSGPSSLIQNVLGTYANTISIVSPYVGLLIRDLTIDGGKSLVTATVNDTFGAGIYIQGYTPLTPSDVQATIDNVNIKNYAQYGISLYGNQCNGVKIVNCNIQDIGITAQALSVGAGIVSAISGSNLTIANNVIKNSKQNGIFISSAGTASGNHVIANNIVINSGASGIGYFEQANYGSISGVGIVQIAITGNVCLSNTRSGIQFNVDTVGLLKNIAITGNLCNNNTYAGIELDCTNTAPNILSDIVVSGNQTIGNGSFQSFAGSNVPLVEGLERSFTPVIRGTTTAGTGTYVAQNGTYVKNGNVVTFQLLVDWSAHTGTGNIEITGFPYAAINAEPTPVGWVWANGLSITGQANLYLFAGQTYGALQASNNGSFTPVAMDTAASIRISGTYLTLD